LSKGTDTGRSARRRPAVARSAGSWLRSNIGAILVLAVMAAVEWSGLRSGTLGIVAIAVAGAIAVILVIARFSMVNIALLTTYAAAFTFTWNGWFIGPARPADALAIVAVFFFALAHSGGHLPRLPVWVWQIVVVILFVLALNIIFRPDPVYLAGRTVYLKAGIGSPLTLKPFVSTNLSVANKFVIATAVVPLVFVWAATYGANMTKRLMVLFSLGSAVSGWVALLSLEGITTLNRLTHIIVPGAPRQVGMAYQPNYLAAGVVLAIPVGIYLIVSSTRLDRWMGWFITAGCLLGAYASGSRGGAVCAVFAVGISILLVPKARKFAVPSIFVALTAVNAIVLLVPSFGQAILRATRLVGASATTDPSNQARGIAAGQALRDFFYSPIHGIGYQASFDAQTVYLQELQAGGIILFVGMLVYNFAAIGVSFRMIRLDPLASALCAAVVSSLVLDIFEADITDRFYYVPVAAIVALHYATRPAATPEPADPSGAGVRSGPPPDTAVAPPARLPVRRPLGVSS
jgi:O-Antigen ligase